MKITKEYDGNLVVLTVHNPPLPTTKHSILPSALASGKVSLETEIAKLTAEAEEKLRVHQAVLGMMIE